MAHDRDLFDIVADVSRWPVIFRPTVHVELLQVGVDSERFRLWALTNGQVKNWISRRLFDRSGLRIRFHQEQSQAPIASMGGEWSFEPLSDGRCEVTLEHHFTAVDDDREASKWITAAVEANSVQELASLARLAEMGAPVDDIVVTFSDVMKISGASADAYSFMYRCDRWPERLGHVHSLSLREDVPGIQYMEMETVTSDGDRHTTRSVRLCFPADRIVYKQLLAPAMLLGHSGTWDFTDGPSGAVVTATHSFAIDPVAATELGTSNIAVARQHIQAALSANSRATLAQAAEFAHHQAAS